jgi:hypothetical protein
MNLSRWNKADGRTGQPSPHHQGRLLALVKDDLDRIYMQFLEFGVASDLPRREG